MEKTDYMRVKEALDDAENSTIPFPVVQDGEMAVVGDANETEINRHDFTMHFRVPQDIDGKTKYVMKEVKYNNLYITPRQDIKVVRLITEMLPYFKKIMPDGTVGEYKEGEIWDILEAMDDKVFDLMYDLTAFFLGVDPSLKDYMVPGDVIESTVKILKEYKEVVNEADTFFE